MQIKAQAPGVIPSVSECRPLCIMCCLINIKEPPYTLEATSSPSLCNRSTHLEPSSTEQSLLTTAEWFAVV